MGSALVALSQCGSMAIKIELLRSVQTSAIVYFALLTRAWNLRASDVPVMFFQDPFHLLIYYDRL